MRITPLLLTAFTLLFLPASFLVNLAPAQERQLHIHHAVYGNEGQGKDVANRLRGMIRDDRLDIAVDNDSVGGDPNEHAKKTLKVDYLYRGRSSRKVVNEQDRLILA